MRTETVSILLPAGQTYTSNQQRQMHWSRQSSINRHLRHRGAIEARGIQPMRRASLLIRVIHPRADKRRDPPNWWPTAKHLIDGVVDAGLIADDSSKYIPRTSFEGGIDPTIARGWLRIELIFTEDQ